MKRIQQALALAIGEAVALGFVQNNFTIALIVATATGYLVRCIGEE